MASRTTWYILMPTLAVSGLLLTVGVSGAWYVQQVNQHVSDSLHESLASAQSVERLVLGIRDLRLKLNRFADEGDLGQLQEARSSIRVIEDELHAVTDLGLRGKEIERVLAQRLRSAALRLQPLRDTPADRHEARLLVVWLNDQLREPAEQLLADRQDQTTQASHQNQAMAEGIGIGLLLLGVCGAVAGVLAGFGMARSVHRSLVEVNVPVRDIAGRLNEVVGPIKVSSNTDLAELDGALRMLADKTGDVVKRLQESQQEQLRHEQLAAVGHLAAGLAHELRNPLMSMKLIVQTALERGGTMLHARDLEVLEDETTRLERMLQTFLDFARPPLPQKQVIDIHGLIHGALELVRPRADQQDVLLHDSLPEQAVLVEVDASQMRQVLLNVLINALDALPNGGNVWLTVADESDWVVIRIADDGLGVPADVAQRVFEPFVSTKVTGIGLGLSISHRIVEAHSGRISVGNRREGGAEFTICLPTSMEESKVPIPKPAK